jgi:hypothetical protein
MKEMYNPLAARNDANGPWGPIVAGGAKDEQDPNGYEAGKPGAKLDAGKVSVTRGCLHYFPRALTAVAELSGIGAKKYSWKGWEKVPDGVARYSDALGRHELRIEGDFNRRDGDTGVLEATAVAWNALARLELILREQQV